MRLTIILLLGLVVFGCKKSEDRNCFKSTGGLSVRDVELDDFGRVFLGPHLKYVFIQDTVNRLEVVGGKNIINFVETTYEGDLLNIKNINKCNFLRSYDKKMTVYIHFKDLYNITFEGTEEVTCKSTLNLNDVVLTIRDGAGEFNLSINANSLQAIVTHGWGNFNFDGNVNYLKLDVNSNGFGNTNALKVSDSVLVISKSVETVKVNADNCLLRAENSAAGDIWYVGNPTQIIHHNNGEGSLLDKN